MQQLNFLIFTLLLALAIHSVFANQHLRANGIPETVFLPEEQFIVSEAGYIPDETFLVSKDPYAAEHPGIITPEENYIVSKPESYIVQAVPPPAVGGYAESNRHEYIDRPLYYNAGKENSFFIPEHTYEVNPQEVIVREEEIPFVARRAQDPQNRPGQAKENKLISQENINRLKDLPNLKENYKGFLHTVAQNIDKNALARKTDSDFFVGPEFISSVPDENNASLAPEETKKEKNFSFVKYFPVKTPNTKESSTEISSEIVTTDTTHSKENNATLPFFPLSIPQDGNFQFLGITFNGNEAQIHTVNLIKNDDGNVRVILPDAEFVAKPFILEEGSDETTIKNKKGDVARLLPIKQDSKQGLFLHLANSRLGFVDKRYFVSNGGPPFEHLVLRGNISLQLEKQSTTTTTAVPEKPLSAFERFKARCYDFFSRLTGRKKPDQESSESKTPEVPNVTSQEVPNQESSEKMQ